MATQLKTNMTQFDIIQVQVGQHLETIAQMFKNPVITVLVRSPDLPNGDFILTNDSFTEVINAVRKMKEAEGVPGMTLSDLVNAHKDLGSIQQFIGNVLPESIQPEDLEAFSQVTTILEKMVVVMKKNAIKHQFT